MNIQSKPPTTPDEFLRWNEGREGKWDLVDGRVVDMMVKVSRNHAMVCANLLSVLRTSLPFPPFTVSSADFGVKTATSVRYPDVMVDGEMGAGSDFAAAAPVLIAEVLSPSTMPIDFGPKAEEYQTIKSLRHYLVLSQDLPQVWLWSRGEDGAWSEPEMIEGRDGSLSLPGLGLVLSLDRLYVGIGH
jgi:Uma2 family endonuclease